MAIPLYIHALAQPAGQYGRHSALLQETSITKAHQEKETDWCALVLMHGFENV